MRDDDTLFFCADHGTDPKHSGWDHTREYVPVIAYGPGIKAGVDIGTRDSFADIGATIADILGVGQTEIGDSFWTLIRAGGDVR